MRGYRFCLIKAYFDKGWGLTNYFKYMIAFYGLASDDPISTLIIGLVYGMACFFIGWFWYHSKMIEAEYEVENRFNLFVKEMRQSHSAHRKT